MSEGVEGGSHGPLAFQRACEKDECVEIATVNAVAVRDSKAPGGPVLLFTYEEWNDFVTGVRAGRFDFS